MSALFGFTCAGIGVLFLLSDGSGQAGPWFMLGAIWFHLANTEADR